MIVFKSVASVCFVVAILVATATLVVTQCMAEKIAAKKVSFLASDGGRVEALLWGTGTHGVVLAHGAIFNKESWNAQSELLAEKGFRVLAIDFRGYGESRQGSEGNALHLDVLAAIRYLKGSGAKRVSVVGGSMGGGAAARAAVEINPGQIDRLILLAHSPVSHPEKLKGKKLFIVSSGDGIRKSVEQQFAAAPEPKKLLILEGKAHAQHVFQAPEAKTLEDAIVSWLSDDVGEDTAR